MDAQVNNDIPAWTPVCQVCKIQNETLRVVAYPYVVSVIFMTFQRAFSGIFCAKHRRRYHLLASLITSIAGWLGIPFGFFLTPLTLFNLARGGMMNEAQNAQLLRGVAEKKLSAGDTTGAIRCLEESLKLQDLPEIRERLAKLYPLHRPADDVSGLEAVWRLISIPMLLLVVSVTGSLLGLFDLLLGFLLSPLYGEHSMPLFIFILISVLIWVPTVTMLFFGILTVRAMLRWTLSKNKGISLSLGSVLAYLSTFLAFYSVLQGQALLRNLYGLVMFFTLSQKDGFFATRSVLTHGGVDVLINNFSQADLSSIIFAILFIAAVGLSLFVGLEMVLHTVKGQPRLLQIRESLSTENPSGLAWGILGVMVLGFIVFIALTFPGKYVNIENAAQEVNLGMTAMDQYHYEEAVSHFKKAVDIWDTSATSHMFLGVGYYSQDQYERGMEELELSLALDPNSMVAHLGRAYNLVREGRFRESVDEFKYLSKSQPEWGLPHAVLASTYYLLDEIKLADQEIQIALNYEKEDDQTSAAIAAYYFQRLDFKKAEQHILRAIQVSKGEDAEDYILLARIYMAQNKFAEAKKAIGEANEVGADPISVYLANARIAEFQNDLEAASSILEEAIQLYPEQSDLRSENSYILFQKGQIDQAILDAEKAVEINPYNAWGYIEQAFAYHAQGRLEEAFQAAEHGVALSPKQDRGHYILALCYMDLGMKEEAVKEFETFLNLYWERPQVKAYKEKALIYLEQLK